MNGPTWRYQRKEGWGDIWRTAYSRPTFEMPEDWTVEEIPATQSRPVSGGADDLLGEMRHGHACPIADRHYAWAVAEIERLRGQLSPVKMLVDGKWLRAHVEADPDTDCEAGPTVTPHEHKVGPASYCALCDLEHQLHEDAQGFHHVVRGERVACAATPPAPDRAAAVDPADTHYYDGYEQARSDFGDRAAVIEECAKVAERTYADRPWHALYRNAGESIAAAIRALAPKGAANG